MAAHFNAGEDFLVENISLGHEQSLKEEGFGIIPGFRLPRFGSFRDNRVLFPGILDPPGKGMAFFICDYNKSLRAGRPAGSGKA